MSIFRKATSVSILLFTHTLLSFGQENFAMPSFIPPTPQAAALALDEGVRPSRRPVGGALLIHVTHSDFQQSFNIPISK